MSGGRRVVTGLFLLIMTLALSTSVYSQYGYGQYGAPAPSKTILIDKLVNKPNSENFVNNLAATDPRFSAGQTVLFKLIIKNTSDIELKNVVVKDFIPEFIDPIEHPGSFDSANRIISFNAGDFKVGEEKHYLLKMRVVAQNRLPTDRGVICLINRAEAKAEDVFDEDSAQFCIEKEVLEVKEVPAAGPGAGSSLLAINLFGVGVGFWLRKKRAI